MTNQQIAEAVLNYNGELVAYASVCIALLALGVSYGVTLVVYLLLPSLRKGLVWLNLMPRFDVAKWGFLEVLGNNPRKTLMILVCTLMALPSWVMVKGAFENLAAERATVARLTRVLDQQWEATVSPRSEVMLSRSPTAIESGASAGKRSEITDPVSVNLSLAQAKRLEAILAKEQPHLAALLAGVGKRPQN